MKLNERLSKARKEKGLTQEELADLAQVTVRTIQRIEYGESMPRSYTLKSIAKALALPYESLTAEEDIKQTSDFPGILNLSCFAYLVLPWVHFLVPAFLLKKQQHITGAALAFSRKVIRQQLYWTVALHLLLLLTFMYNYLLVTIAGNTYYFIPYWVISFFE